MSDEPASDAIFVLRQVQAGDVDLDTLTDDQHKMLETLIVAGLVVELDIPNVQSYIVSKRGLRILDTVNNDILMQIKADLDSLSEEMIKPWKDFVKDAFKSNE